MLERKNTHSILVKSRRRVKKKNYIFAGHSGKTSVLIFPPDFSIQSSVISNPNLFRVLFEILRESLRSNGQRTRNVLID